MRSPNHCILCQFRNYLEISNEFGIVHKFSIFISRMDNRTYQLCKDSLHLVKIWELLDILDYYPSFLFVYAMAICLEIILCITCIFIIAYFFKCWKKHIFLKGWNKRHTFYCQVYLCIRITRPLKHSAMARHAIFQFECCGVNKVVGTINDFEPTYWCKTEGSCHATSSQIPRTCCKGFTENDYQNAPIECKSSVKSGSYYDKVTTLTNRKNIMLK